MAERPDKLSERVPLNLTEQEFNDLARMAVLEDRGVGEFIRLRIVRPYLYGTVKRLDTSRNENGSGYGALGGPEV